MGSTEFCRAKEADGRESAPPDPLRIVVMLRYYVSRSAIDRMQTMLDGVSLDQLRAFIAAVDEGSFSAGARKLRRAQSAISELVSNLEGQIGIALFDRSARYPKLTPAGTLLLSDARSVLANVDHLKERAKDI